jgi:eukaryotic-like serine/threonine-protein kinase
MPLSPGDHLGPYEILAPIGAGGMGEVYKARDTKLDREVAVKVLPASLARDPERLARFEREAKVLASLNHPNIAQIYGIHEGIGDSTAARALIMELVPGHTLKGPLALDETLRIATQIAEALDAAHEKGIVHRDLKPANIMVTPTGIVKVLDFGLAAVTQPSASGNGDPSQSPTMTMGLSQAGMVMGTAGYMAPEQAAGQAVDKRSDIWAFGVVLWEMLTGERLFTGDTVAHILASVLTKEPDWQRVPFKLRRLLRACLQKEPKKRLQAIGDWALLIADDGPAAPAPVAVQPASRLRWLWLSLAALAIICAMGVSFIHLRETPPPEPPAAQFEVPSPTPRVGPFALSPDGRYLVMSGHGRSRLWVRPIDSLEARELPGTEDAVYPFWSPDSASIGFIADGKLKKIALAGGEAQVLCDASGNAGGSWGANGTILFGLNGVTRSSRAMGRVSAAGGVPTPVTKVAVEGDAHKYPELLPDGRHFLYLVTSEKSEISGIYMGSLDGSPPVRLLPDQSSAAYVPATASTRDGYLLFRRGTTLMALPFNRERLQAAGEMFPLAQQVATTGNAAHAGFSVLENGTLVYLSGPAVQQQELAFLDRTGKRLGSLGKTGSFRSVALSPDDRTAAISIRDAQAGTTDIWLADVARNSVSRLTSVTGAGSTADFPTWSPDGKRIAFSIRPPDSVRRNLYLQAANGTGRPEMLLHATGSDAGPYAWSSGGKFIVYAQSEGKTKRDTWLLPLEGDRKPVPYLNTPALEDFPQLSPDSRWMAYASDESGKAEVYIQAFPQNGTRVQVSAEGGSQPRWRRDGRELFYISADQKMMAVPIQESNASIDAGTPKELFEGAPETTVENFLYQPTADGQRFLVIEPVSDGPAPRLTVVLNWHARANK